MAFSDRFDSIYCVTLSNCVIADVFWTKQNLDYWYKGFSSRDQFPSQRSIARGRIFRKHSHDYTTISKASIVGWSYENNQWSSWIFICKHFRVCVLLRKPQLGRQNRGCNLQVCEEKLVENWKYTRCLVSFDGSTLSQFVVLGGFSNDGSRSCSTISGFP